MRSEPTLRGRLATAYAAALIVALLAFAIAALAIVDRAQRSALDTRLLSASGALAIVGDDDHGRFGLDAKDREQFFTVLGSKAQGAILEPPRTILVSSDDTTAQALARRFTAVDRPTYASERVGNREIRVLAQPLIEGGRREATELVWSDLEPIGNLDGRVTLAFLVAIPIIALCAMIVGGAIARRGLEPLERVATLASAIEAHDLTERLGTISPDRELSHLAATIDRMLDRLEAAFDRERRFTSDASHELRAPLSVIRAEADLALRSDRSGADYRRALETIAEEADALERLTRDLLAAARSGDGGEDARMPIDLGDLAAGLADRFAATAGTRRIAVVKSGAERAVVAGNRPLIERAVVGALHNALKYAPEEGNVAIDVATHAGRAVLTIVDDGPGFTPSALEHAFDRFWRDDEARGRDGSGLGLSIAKTIVERFDGSIALANAEPSGAIVQIDFPLAVGD